MTLILKEDPNDFYVEEIISKDYFRPANTKIRLYKAEKKNISHKEMEKILAEKTANRTLHFAGIKDKNAHTVQYFTTYAEIPEFEYNKDESLLRITFCNYTEKQIYVGCHKENYFRIKTNYFKKYKEVLHWGTPNYFDEQRFGNTYYYEFIKALIKKDYNKALQIYLTRDSKSAETQTMRKEIMENWENLEKLSRETKAKMFEINPHKMEIYHLILNQDFRGAILQLNKKDLSLIYKQYQSDLFNDKLKTTLSKNKHIKYDNLVYNTDRITKKLIKLEKTDDLDELGIKTRDLTRENVFYPKNLKLTKLEKDLGVIEFNLQPGSYATILIKHLYALNYL